MTKIKYIIVFLLFSFGSVFSINSKKLHWVKISTNSNQELKFVAGNSKNDFWVQTIQGALLNIKDKKIITYNIPRQFGHISTRYFQLSENDFFCSATTSDWKGEIFRIKNNIWSKYKFINPYPIRDVLRTLDNNFYIIGDFGTLLKYVNNDWQRIKTPFKSHIISGIVNGNNLYFATRSEGIILYDGKHFTNLSKLEKNKYIIELKIIDNVLYGITSNDKLYSFENNIEKLVNNTEVLKIFANKNYNSNFGFADRLIYSNGNKSNISFPQSYNIESITQLKDSSFLLFSNNGKIFISEKSKSNYFVNLAQIYRIDDLPNSLNNGVQFFDANLDGINDLLVINNNYGNYITLFRGVENSAFANITSISNLPFKDNPIWLFTISDLNKDNLPDLVFQIKEDSLQKLLIYNNLGNFRFEKSNEIILPDDFQTFGLRNLSAFDYDKDGDNDIINTAYYGASDNPGYATICVNNFWGVFNKIDTSLTKITTHWNEKLIFADLNSDDILDIFNPTSWASDRVFFGSQNGSSDIMKSTSIEQKKTETVDALLADYDNDGDLDIFTVGRNDFIRVYSNDGNGNFYDMTSNLFLAKFLEKTNILYSHNLNLGDFNNDSFIDILVSVTYSDSNYTAIFLNQTGKNFIETPIDFETITNTINFSSICDFDNDGDLDIYGASNKQNVFWINTFDKNNSIKLKLNGVISSTDALGSKIWVYEAGQLDNSNYLIGYKELGTEGISRNRANDLTAHFGLNKTEKCDIRIKFLSGEEIILKEIDSGSNLIINEISALESFIYRLPGNIYRFVTNFENQIYIFLIICSHIILILGVWFGHNRLGWTIKLSLIFIIMNISLFWISLYFSAFSKNDSIKFLIPIGLTILVTFIPLILFYWLNSTNKKNIFAYNEKLLQLIMAFSHGEWALRNLNSIILLCENPPINYTSNTEFVLKLQTRLDTFLKMTSSSINEIIEYEKLIGNNNEELVALDGISKETVEIVKLNINKINELSLAKLVDNFTDIRNNIKELRNIVYSRYSSNPTEVINNLITNYENIFEDNNIIIEKKKLYPQEILVLIKSYELGNIIDNLFQNSIRFMKNSDNKYIKIDIYKESPKIIINFSNTGSSISEEKWTLIFEQGYSESGSTGQGLFSAQEILKKYGGRIQVSNSDMNLTTFKIELNEGVIAI